MSAHFGQILKGLIHRRRLSERVVCRAMYRAESTVRGLMSGSIPPERYLLLELSPVLGIDVRDFHTIAGVTYVDGPPHPGRIRPEIARLLALANDLTAEQIQILIAEADSPYPASPAS